MVQPLVTPQARAVADTDAGLLLATVDIAAPPERIFRALTTDEVVAWWGSDEMYWTTAWEGEARPGGRYRATGRGADGQSFAVEGEYREIESPGRIVHTWTPSWESGAPTTVTIRLEPLQDGGGTRLTLRHEGFAGRAAECRNTADGWARVLGWLAAHVAPPEARAYLCRLVAPRATFPADITPEEGALMGQHAHYWRSHIPNGQVVVFGPVADPGGVWGLAVLRAVDDAAARAFTDADPVIAADRGFRFEILPMLTAIAQG